MVEKLIYLSAKRRHKALCILALFICAFVTRANASQIDPIRFSVSTTATHVALNEEFEIEIAASYLRIPSSAAFVFEGANSFRLKMIMPVGFVQTGGDFKDFEGTELNSAKPFIRYTVKGKFVDKSGDGLFQLIRGNKNANDQSTYVRVATLGFKMDDGEGSVTDSNARIAAVSTPGYVPYLTIAQLRATGADTAKAVYITDNGRFGLFRHNTSSSAPDDGAIVIVAAGGKRYERVYSGPVDVTWFGVVADGVTDQTAAIQGILNHAQYRRDVYFPKASASYRIKTIKLLSHTSLTFQEGTIVEGMGTLGLYERMIVMYDVDDIIIKAPNVIFKDHNENYTTGQWRHIFSIEGVFNAVIEGMAANDSGGDGFYIGAGSARKYCDNVKIINVSANNNRRMGMSIISGKNIDVINPILTKTTSNGEGPGAGLDIEPNSAENFLEGIRIVNPRTKDNRGPGIIIGPHTLAGSDRVLDIVISNHVDEGSHYGFLVTTVKSALLGSIVIENPTWKNSRASAFVARNWGFRAPGVDVINPTVINANTGGQTSPNLGAAFLIYRPAEDTGDTNLGNIHIFRPKIIDTRVPQKITSTFCFRDIAGGHRIYNCSVIDPIKVSTTIGYKHIIAHNTELTLSDKHNTLTLDFAAVSRTIDYGFMLPFFHNQSSTATRILTLTKVNPNFPEITVEVRAPYPVRIVPFSTDNIAPIAAAAGKYITSNVVGSRITLKKTTDNSWFVKEMVGTWTVQP